MFIGDWFYDCYYKKGDVVFIPERYEYYVCCKDHQSTILSYPSKEDLYWVSLSSNFIDYVITLNKEIPKLKLPNPNNKKIKKPVSKLKRKLDYVEKEIENYKKKRLQEDCSDKLRDRLMLLNVDIATKSYLIEKHDSTSRSFGGSETSKTLSWLNTVASIPHGKFKNFTDVDHQNKETIKNFFLTVRNKLDKNIYGLDDIKQEIMEFLARRITNPDGKGHVLALCGPKGCGKTKIIKSLSEALKLPFFQINCGGLNDASVLIGHSETYVGAKPGKIVECLTKSEYMNPIIYFDEVDKISTAKAQEINGILTHLFDEEQNDKFQDNYLSSVLLDLSKVFFVISFNDISSVNEIVSDRMTIINVKSPNLQEKITISKEKMIKEVINSINISENITLTFEDDIIEYIISNKCRGETGVRQLKKTFEKLINRFNYDLLTDSETLKSLGKEKYGDSDENDHEQSNKNNCNYIFTKTYIDKVIKTSSDTDMYYLSMYM